MAAPEPGAPPEDPGEAARWRAREKAQQQSVKQRFERVSAELTRRRQVGRPRGLSEHQLYCMITSVDHPFLSVHKHKAVPTPRVTASFLSTHAHFICNIHMPVCLKGVFIFCEDLAHMYLTHFCTPHPGLRCRLGRS